MPNLCIVPARALSDARLTFREVRALLAVGMYTNHAGKGVWASQRTMADRANMTRSQMNEALARLEELGYIVKRRRFNDKGAELTCMIDVVLDAPPQQEGVPDLGTGGVPKMGTGGVPDLGTQTTHTNVPTTMMMQSDAKIPPEYTEDYATILSQSRNPTAVIRELVALNSGMHGTFSWEVIGRALRDMVVSGAAISPRSLRKFCEGVDKPDAPPRSTSPRPKRGIDVEALARKLEEPPAPKE